jgi:thiol-disulfide isomerase/thioredoxin
MKNKWLLATIIISLALIGFYLYQKYRLAPKLPFAKLNVVNADGQVFNFKQLDGTPYIITFYASWCKDCLKELPILDEQIQRHFKNMPVYAITDEELEKLIEFRDKHQYRFNYLKLKKSFRYYDINTIPTIYFIDKHGQIIYTRVGHIDWDNHSILEHIKLNTY